MGGVQSASGFLQRANTAKTCQDGSIPCPSPFESGKPASAGVRDAGFRIEWGSMGQQGWRAGMEDTFCIYDEGFEKHGRVMFAVFDGHGGPHTSLALEKGFGPYLWKKIKDNKGVIDQVVMAKAFLEFDQVLMKDPKHMDCGSTGTVCVVDTVKQLVHVAHIGDSRAMVFRHKSELHRTVMSEADHQRRKSLLGRANSNMSPMEKSGVSSEPNSLLRQGSAPGLSSAPGPKKKKADETKVADVPEDEEVHGSADGKVVSRVDSTEAHLVYVTRDHAPTDPSERQRIVTAGRIDPGITIRGNRVVVDNFCSLNLCRAFGDHRFKRIKELPSTRQPVCAAPEYWEASFLQLFATQFGAQPKKKQDTTDPESTLVILLASDGIWGAELTAPLTAHKESDICRQMMALGREYLEERRMYRLGLETPKSIAGARHGRKASKAELEHFGDIPHALKLSTYLAVAADNLTAKRLPDWGKSSDNMAAYVVCITPTSGVENLTFDESGSSASAGKKKPAPPPKLKEKVAAPPPAETGGKLEPRNKSYSFAILPGFEKDGKAAPEQQPHSQDSSDDEPEVSESVLPVPHVPSPDELAKLKAEAEIVKKTDPKAYAQAKAVAKGLKTPKQ